MTRDDEASAKPLCREARCGRPQVRPLQKSLQGSEVCAPTGPTFAFSYLQFRNDGSFTWAFVRGTKRASAKVQGVGAHRSNFCRNACKGDRCGRK